MRIQGSNVLLASQHSSINEVSRSESLKIWVGNNRPDFENRAKAVRPPSHYKVDLSRLTGPEVQNSGKERTTAAGAGNREENTGNDHITMLISMLSELITGKKIKITAKR